ncbi:MAG: hypothetical protein D8B56_02765 [Alloprevotella sp.]|nr:MAG: hypothetical protein D8B56_02765 [Alloprevotella sp.]
MKMIRVSVKRKKGALLHASGRQKYTYFPNPTTFCLKSLENSNFPLIFANDYTSYHNKAICRRFFNLKDRAQLFSFGYGLIFLQNEENRGRLQSF